MFKKIIFVAFIFSILYLNNLNANEEITADSKIINVIVYPEWAYVTKKANIITSDSSSRITFKHLPTWIDPSSIIIKLSPPETNKIINIETNTVILKQIAEKEVLNVKDKLTALQDSLENLKTELKALDNEKKYLTGYLTWKTTINPDEKISRKIEIEEINSIDNYLKKSFLDNFNRENDINRKIRNLQPEIDSWQKKWNELQSKANLEEKEISIDIESPKGSKLEIYLNYLISGASWYPIYDARIGPDKKSINIEYAATVQQSTGEDWSGAQFVLSSIQPYLIKEKPELNPLYINSYNEKKISRIDYNRATNEEYMDDLKKIQSKQSELMNSGERKDQQAFENLKENYQQALNVMQQVEERGTNVEFNINGKYSIKTDGKPVKLLIGNANFDVTNSYSSIPAVSKSTYVSGEIKNTSEFLFLPGVVNIYQGGTFIGKSKMDFVAEKEKFDIYMGLEERIKAVRKLDIKKSSTAVFGLKKNLKVRYNIDIQNFLADPIIIEIKDQIPVSQNDSIKVKINNIDPKTDKIDNGIMTWKINLNPSEKKTLYFEFEIEYPKDVKIDKTMDLEKQIYKSME